MAKDQEEAGTELDLPEAIHPTELQVIEALHIPIGFRDVTDSGETMAGILQQIIEAGSVEKALAEGVVEGLQAYTGRVLTFLDFKYQPSEYNPEGWPFVVIRAADEDGQGRTVTTGAKQVVVMLALAKQTGELPFKARVDVTDFTTDEGELRRAVKLVQA